MRFVPDGPDIPNLLIRKWRDGEVLFLAGAGVSVPSNLPLFEGLALEVYEYLRDPLFAILKKAMKSPDNRAEILHEARLPPAQQVEANLFFDKEFDRFFSAIEKRIDPDRKGKEKTRNVRNAVENILASDAFSDSHKDLLRLSLSRNSSADPSKPSSAKIATTNFDLLFEAAWKIEFGSDPISHDARMAPRPGAHDFTGIIHLHGALSGHPKHAANYILSSRDFARVYLRSGVIGNYVYELIRRYTLILIGYSADDPPMRYLMDAIGEDASLFDDMNQAYAITDAKAGVADIASAIEEAEWQAKEIAAIFFQRRAGQAPFAPLWESIHLWAEWARNQTSWVKDQLKQKTANRHADATTFQRAFVQDILSVLSPEEVAEAVEFLNTEKVDFAWIDAVNPAINAAAGAVEGRSLNGAT
jgi:hypothetical protein